MTMRTIVSRLLLCERGAMAIETALVAPVLAIMSIGTFEVGTMVSRQQELQSAASEVESIILAAATGTGAASDDIEAVIEDSLNPSNSRPDLEVSLEQRFRCHDVDALVLDGTGCDTTKPIYRYVRLEISDRYTPVWVDWGVGSAFDYDVVRTIMVK